MMDSPGRGTYCPGRHFVQVQLESNGHLFHGLEIEYFLILISYAALAATTQYPMLAKGGTWLLNENNSER